MTRTLARYLVEVAVGKGAPADREQLDAEVEQLGSWARMLSRPLSSRSEWLVEAPILEEGTPAGWVAISRETRVSMMEEADIQRGTGTVRYRGHEAVKRLLRYQRHRTQMIAALEAPYARVMPKVKGIM